MVAAPLHAVSLVPARSAHRWWAYLGASLALNLLLASALGSSQPVAAPRSWAVLKIHLMSPGGALAQEGRARAPRSELMAQANVPDADMADAEPETDERIARAADTSAGRVLSPARTRRQVPPAYPPRARELGQQGLVVLHAEIARDGAPLSVQVARSSGYPLLDRAAAAAVRQWEFEALRRQTQTAQTASAAQWVRVPVRFVIEP